MVLIKDPGGGSKESFLNHLTQNAKEPVRKFHERVVDRIGQLVETAELDQENINIANIELNAFKLGLRPNLKTFIHGKNLPTIKALLRALEAYKEGLEAIDLAEKQQIYKKIYLRLTLVCLLILLLGFFLSGALIYFAKLRASAKGE